MSETTRLVSYLRSAWLPALCIMLMSFFAYHAIVGSSGILALGGYKAEQARLSATSAALEARRQKLQHKIALLDPDRVDPDYADELVRENLGVLRDDEFVIHLQK